MFSKKNKNTKKKTTALRVSVPSIIVADLNISGDLVSDGAIEVGGKVYGNIRCNVVTIRKGAYIKGDIIANELLIQGKVEGTVTARSATLADSAEVNGEIIYSYLSMDAGANIDGSCKKVADKEVYEVQSEDEQSIEYIPSISDVFDEESNKSSANKKEASSEVIVEESDIPEVEVIETSPEEVANDSESEAKKDTDSAIEINLFDVDDNQEESKSKLKKKKKRA